MVYTHAELSEACNSFPSKSLIGKGGFGSVYKGNLRKCAVAVKVLTEVRLCYCMLYCVYQRYS